MQGGGGDEDAGVKGRDGQSENGLKYVKKNWSWFTKKGQTMIDSMNFSDVANREHGECDAETDAEEVMNGLWDGVEN